MNLANWLTVLRIILIIPFVLFLLNGYFLIALIIFAAASITDWLDGFIARKYNMITDLGKFLDPLADKILVISALVCFIEVLNISSWLVVIIIAREFIVTGFRLAVVEKDNKAVISADIWGKIKTAVTMIVICWILAMEAYKVCIILSDTNGALQIGEASYDIPMYVVVALTVFSGITMIIKNKKLFKGADKK
jgi:CDP-diacylglycerol--glycerol-3-phosphate 3-phosphatidyltransferase